MDIIMSNQLLYLVKSKLFPTYYRSNLFSKSIMPFLEINFTGDVQEILSILTFKQE